MPPDYPEDPKGVLSAARAYASGPSVPEREQEKLTRIADLPLGCAGCGKRLNLDKRGSEWENYADLMVACMACLSGREVLSDGS